MIRRLFLYLTLSVFLTGTLSAQEVVTGLRSNNIIINARNKQVMSSRSAASDTLQLPFFDDFSGRSYFPDKSKWLDDFVFINNTFSDKQPTKGIATFDELDNTGRIYETASPSGFQADQLTSVPINLGFAPADNIWLSFFYQAGGLGDSPEPEDSLTLQFFAPLENQWYSIWRAAGTTDRSFKAAILRITDTRFLKKGFQFRFINYASLSQNMNDPSMVGNGDQWNLDYVLLGKNRNAGDTIFADVAMTLPLRSLLKTYEAMPWNQFKVVELQEMGSSIPVHYRNNDTITRNVTRNFEIWDLYRNSLSYIFSAGASNIGPLTSIDYNANLVYTYNTSNNDSALFRVTAALKTDQFDPKENDTIIYYQVFRNYFAFDDGSAEAGYGINGLGSRNAMFAHRFQSYIPDTLRAIQICFNESYLDANKRAFDLAVWDDNNGVPGNMLYTLEEVMVEQGNMINGFYTYRIPDKVPVSDLFYVGWRQRSETFLNAGLDVNTPHLGRQFYWLNGEWQESQVGGTVMIRPVVGEALRITSVDDIINEEKNPVKIFPNPATDFITVDPGDMMISGTPRVTILDINGRELKKLLLTGRIDISSFPAGVYIIITSLNGKPVGYNRLVKTR